MRGLDVAQCSKAGGLHKYPHAPNRPSSNKRRQPLTGIPYRSHYKQLVLEHMGDIPSATLTHNNRDLDAADALVALSGGNLANRISDVADTVERQLIELQYIKHA